MSIYKAVDLSIYHYESIKKIYSLFSGYINIKITELNEDKLEISFEGDNEEIYCKEFFNYLIIAESRKEN